MTATIKFSQLPNLTTIQANTTIPVVDTGNNYTMSVGNLQTYFNFNPYGDANVAAFLPTYSGNIGTLSSTGNVSATYFFGNGSALTGIVPSNSLSALALANGTSNITSQNYGGGPAWYIGANGVSNIVVVANNFVSLNKSTTVNGVFGVNGDTQLYNGNVSIAAGGLCNVAQSTTFYNANVSMTQSTGAGLFFLKLTTTSAANARAKTGSVGQVVSITDNSGKIAYWDTTNNRWSYINGDTAV